MKSFATVLLSATALSSAGYAQVVDLETSGAAINEFAFDSNRNALLVSTTAGTVDRYDLDLGAFLDPITLGGSLYGMDLTPDGETLYVAQQTPTATRIGPLSVLERDVVIHSVDLATLAVNDVPLTVLGSESGVFDIAIGSQGVGLFSTNFEGSGWVPFRQIDTATDTITPRTDFTSIRQSSYLISSEDQSHILLRESNISSGPIHLYDSATDTFIASVDNFTVGQLPSFANAVGAINGEAELVAVQRGSSAVLLDFNLDFVAELQPTTTTVAGIAFAPDGSTVYLLDATRGDVYAYDTATLSFTERYFLNGAPSSLGFGTVNGLFVTPDGGTLVAARSDGFELLNFATYVPFCDESGGAGGTVTCSSETSRAYSSTLDGITVDVTSTAVFNGGAFDDSFDLGGDGVTLNNAGRIDGATRFTGAGSADRLFNAGELNGLVNFGGGDDIAVNQSGGVITSFSFDLGAGEDVLTLEAGSRISAPGAISLGQGSDTLIVENGAIVDGFVSGVDNVGGPLFTDPDVDTLDLRADGADLARFTGFEIARVNVDGEVGLSSASARFASSFALERGALVLSNGTLTGGDIAFADGTRVSGYGTLAPSAAVTFDGAVVPAAVAGAVPSPLIIAGGAVLGATSVLEIPLLRAADPANASSGLNTYYGRLQVTGQATLESGALSIVRANDAPAAIGETSLAVISASGVEGTFGAVSAPDNVAVHALDYRDDEVVVVLRTNLGAGGPALSESAAAAGGYLDGVALTTDDPASVAFISRLAALDAGAGEVETALSELAPETYASVSAMARGLSLGVLDTLVGEASRDERRAGRTSFWLTGMNDRTDHGGAAAGPAGYDGDATAGLFGIDVDAGDRLSLGIFFGGATLDQNDDDGLASTKSDGFVGGAQLRVQAADTEGRLVVGGFAGDAETRRVAPTLGVTPLGAYDLDSAFASGSLSHVFSPGSGLEIAPHLRATLLRVGRGGFDEALAGDANLSVDAQNHTFAYSDIGLTARPVDGVFGGRIAPYVSGGVRYEWLNEALRGTAGLAAETERFVFDGLRPPRELGYVDVGLSMDVVDSVAIRASYQNERGEDFARQSARVAVAATF